MLKPFLGELLKTCPCKSPTFLPPNSGEQGVKILHAADKRKRFKDKLSSLVIYGWKVGLGFFEGNQKGESDRLAFWF